MTIQTVVMSSGAPASRALSLWLSLRGLAWRYGSRDYGIEHCRNQAVRRFLQEDQADYLLMLDCDMVPIAGTDAILTADGDLCYCAAHGRFDSSGHVGSNNFGAACCRLSRKMLLDLADPWFHIERAGGVMVSCECEYFRRRAVAAGYVPCMVGGIGHEQRCVLLPDGSIAWPPECEGLWTK